MLDRRQAVWQELSDPLGDSHEGVARRPLFVSWQGPSLDSRSVNVRASSGRSLLYDTTTARRFDCSSFLPRASNAAAPVCPFIAATCFLPLGEIAKSHMGRNAKKPTRKTRSFGPAKCEISHQWLSQASTAWRTTSRPSRPRRSSGNDSSLKSVFHTLTQKAINPQVRSGVFEKSAHLFTSLENAPFGIIRT